MTKYNTESGKSNDKPYRDPDILHELHWDDGLCYREMAEELGCHKRTIRRWMDRLDVGRRTPEEGFKLQMCVNYANLDFNASDHPMWSVKDPNTGKSKSFTVHRLLAVAEYGIEQVKGKDVHHKNGIPWDNRPENIELLDHSEHTKLHEPWKDSPIIP